jgi:hypothetical protein
MKVTVIAVVIAAALLLVPAAQAAGWTIIVTSGKTGQIIMAAENGHLRDIYTVAQVEKALDVVQRNPAQYNGAETVLENYLAAHGYLAYTGVSPAIYALGLILMGSGLILRKRSATNVRAR